jgi:hypothetical protein
MLRRRMVQHACPVLPLAPPAVAVMVLGGSRLFSEARIVGADQAFFAARPPATFPGTARVILNGCW